MKPAVIIIITSMAVVRVLSRHSARIVAHLQRNVCMLIDLSTVETKTTGALCKNYRATQLVGRLPYRTVERRQRGQCAIIMDGATDFKVGVQNIRAQLSYNQSTKKLSILLYSTRSLTRSNTSRIRCKCSKHRIEKI